MSAYAELQISTNFSFLRGASHVEELVQTASSLKLAAIAVTDRNSLAGIVRAYGEAEREKIRLVVGCRLDFTDGTSVLCYPTDRAAYGRLVRLLTRGKRRVEKGHCHLTINDLLDFSDGQIVVALGDWANDDLRERLALLRTHFGDRAYMALTRRFRPHEAQRLKDIAQLAQATRVPTVVTNDVLYHAAERRILHDVITCIREKTTLDEMGYKRERSADRFLKPPEEMQRLFKSYPDAVERTLEITRRCTFSMQELQYQYPDEHLVPGLSAQQALEKLTWDGAHWRYPDGIPDKAVTQIDRELKIIGELNYAPYFLTVWRIVSYAKSQGILNQGRGSAANSAVCYCLGITAIDPVRGNSLFERFISRARNEPPDIDVDFEHERREIVIQWIYQTYGRDHAAMTATVIHYRPRRAVREVGKVLGLPEDITGALAKSVWGWGIEGIDDERIKEIGLNLSNRRLRLTLDLSRVLIGFPRHLSQHPGGFVITHDRLDDIVPIENASMEDRTVIEWDKDDIDRLKMMKVDVLGLGMLGCLRRAFDLLREHRNIDLTIATVPAEDPAVYEMLCKADSIGVFQVESRAQMNMLPRLKPRTYYDLVVEVAIVRPGPIQGDMVHPYIRRRNGLEEVTYPSLELKRVLEKTLGVPLFQEQAMSIAMVGSGFSGDEADRLRRAMATFRSLGTIATFERPFIDGMIANGYDRGFAERCFNQIKGFGTYGFPESHAASFAILVYVSSWMKHHHPDVFLCAILNAQPMGFYAPAQLIRDARQHGVEVLDVDVNHSRWDCTLMREGYVQLGFRVVKGIAQDAAEKIARLAPYTNVTDLWRRTGVTARQLQILAQADAFRALGLDRRQALWAVKALRDDPLPLFAGLTEINEPAVRLRELSRAGNVWEDYATLGFSLRDHPLKFLRPRLAADRWRPLQDLERARDGMAIRIAGLVLVRQRPGEGRTIFITMEDETTHANLIVWERTFEQYRRVVMTSRLLGCIGKVQKEEREGLVTHVITEQLVDLTPWLADIDSLPDFGPGVHPALHTSSRDFH